MKFKFVEGEYWAFYIYNPSFGNSKRLIEAKLQIGKVVLEENMLLEEVY